ncbi:MAG: carboxypeptidase regulatory-like domain-containing protein [Acidobacteriota bacterium]
MRRLKSISLTLILVLNSVAMALAQTAATATISGTVTDSSGAAISGATVELADIATNQVRKLATNDSGYYLFPSVTPGNYKITVTMQGFRQTEIPSVKVDVSKAYTVNLSLEVGQVTEKVEVTADIGVELQKHDATVGTVIQGEQLLRLPTINRSAAALLSFQPLVQPSRGQGVLGGGQVAGARSDQNTFNLDGADATDLVAGTSNYTAGAIDFVGPTPMIPVPSESVEELRVGTTNPNATFGRSAGGQINLITKRGSNEFHGSAYWYHQNDNLNANRWEFNRLGIERPELKDNRYGGSFGGPVFKDRTFLFGHYEGRRFNSSASVLRLVPSNELRQGVLRFRDASGATRSYNVRDFDPRDIGLSPVIRNFWSRMPAGNDPTAGDGLNSIGFRGAAKVPLRMDFAVARLDHNFNDNWRLDATYRFSSQDVKDASQLDIAGFVEGNSSGQAVAVASTPVEPRFGSVKLTGQIKPTLINEFIFGWARNWWAYKRAAPSPQVDGTTGALMIALGTLDQGVDVDTQRARSRDWWDNVWQYTDNVNWVKGGHTFQFGGTWRYMPVYHIRDDKVVGSLTSLVYELNARTAVGIPAANRPPTCSATITSNCLQPTDVGRYNDLFAGALGIIDKAGILVTRDAQLNAQPLGTPLIVESSFHAYDLYFNDIWRVSPSLTLSLGLTYSIQTPPIDKNGKQTLLVDAATQQPISVRGFLNQRRAAAEKGQVFNPTLAYIPIRETDRTSIFETDWNNLGPRLAAAWTPSFSDGLLGKLLGDRKTVFRGGYGLTFDRTNGVGIIMIPILGVGFGQTITCVGPRSNGTCLAGSSPTNAFRIGVDGSTIPLPAIGGAASPIIPASTFSETLSFSIDPDLTVGKSHSVDFTVQRELPGNMIVEIGYAGRFGRNLQQNVQMSSVPYFMRDPASGQTLAQAFDAVAQQLRAGVPAANVTRQPWFENQLRGASLCGASGNCTAALAAARLAAFQQGQLNSLFTLINLNRPAGPIINTQVLDLHVRTNGGISNYHSMFVSLTKRFSSGLYFTSNYTWSKSLDQYGLNQEFIGVNSSGFDLDIDYGPSLWDRTHVFNASAYYDLPFGRGARGVLSRLIGGWYVSGLFTANSGLPLSVSQHPQAFGGDPLNFAVNAGAIPIGRLNFGNSVNGGVTVTGNVGSNGNADRRGSGLNLFADPQAVFNSFRPILLAQDGRQGRGTLRGLPRWNLDLGIGKKTTITERVKFVFTADLINALNRVEFNDPSLDLTNPAAFGVLSSQFAGPRAIQFGMRFEF